MTVSTEKPLIYYVGDIQLLIVYIFCYATRSSLGERSQLLSLQTQLARTSRSTESQRISCCHFHLLQLSDDRYLYVQGKVIEEERVGQEQSPLLLQVTWGSQVESHVPGLTAPETTIYMLAQIPLLGHGWEVQHVILSKSDSKLKLLSCPI